MGSSLNDKINTVSVFYNLQKQGCFLPFALTETRQNAAARICIVARQSIQRVTLIKSLHIKNDRIYNNCLSFLAVVILIHTESCAAALLFYANPLLSSFLMWCVLCQFIQYVYI